ncbi:hypothetical protein IKD67_01725 [Candidatus Saccharibacteria bacterium]|nr:hypothetical protein [Candidatus Saccharibacteria bacterium]
MNNAKNCECCNRGVIEDGASEICPICGWEDDIVQNKRPDYNFGANKLSLNEHRKNFEEKIKQDPNYTWEEEAARKIPKKDRNDA